MITKLQAVNNVLRRLGKLPVDALDTNGTSTHAHVERMIDDSATAVQGEGWYWNTKFDVEPPLDGDSKLNVSQLEAKDGGGYWNIYHVDTDYSESKNVVRKGDYLYDIDDNTFVFSGTVKVRYTYERDFAEIPDAFQNLIVSKASFNFNRYYLGNPSLEGALSLEMQSAQRLVNREEIRQADVDVLGTNNMSQIRGRPRSPYRSIY